MKKDTLEEGTAAVHFKDARTHCKFMAFIDVQPPTRPKNIFVSFDTANGAIQMDLRRKDLKRLIKALKYAHGYRRPEDEA